MQDARPTPHPDEPQGRWVAKLDGGLLVNPTVDRPDGVVLGDAPAVHTRAEHRLREAAALGIIFDALVETRWTDPIDPRLNPYRGAKLLLGGWGEFQRGFVKDLQVAARVDPNISGRMLHKSGIYARFAWQAIKAKLRAWSMHYYGVALPPRRVVDIFERTYQPRERLDIRKMEWEVSEHGAFAGIYDEYDGSAMQRTGTLHEIAQDIRNPVARETAHKRIDEAFEQAEAAS